MDLSRPGEIIRVQRGGRFDQHPIRRYQHTAVPGVIVTSGDPWVDSHMAPYALDVVPTSELQPLLQGNTLYTQSPARVMMAQESGESSLARGTSFGGFCQAPQRPEAFYRVAPVIFTGLRLYAPGGDTHEGAVIAVHEPHKYGSDSVGCCLLVSSTIAWCYANGLLAIGEDYDIVRHRMLPAEVRTILDVVNPKALLFLPDENSHWPNLELARLHRRKSGL